MQREKARSHCRAIERLDERLWHQLECMGESRRASRRAAIPRTATSKARRNCLAVEENLSVLIPDDWKGIHFTATDLFVLSAAAALHDAGKAATRRRSRPRLCRSCEKER